MTKLIDGKKIASKIEQQVAASIQQIQGRKPGLAFVLVGNDPASKTYIQAKKKKCAEVGIVSIDHEFPEETSEAKILHEIEHLNRNPAIDGILVQLPLPKQISTPRVMEAVSPLKDVDGFHPMNMGKLLIGESDGFFPCTPYGIVILLHECKIPVAGQHAVIVGRSNIVGKPLAAMLMQKSRLGGATVTVAHSQTKELSALCRTADLLIAATGKPHLITKDMVKQGATIIDVGIHRTITSEGKRSLVGDVAFDEVSPLASYITPVPGGVGPMTIAILLLNTLQSYTGSTGKLEKFQT